MAKKDWSDPFPGLQRRSAYADADGGNRPKPSLSKVGFAKPAPPKVEGVVRASELAPAEPVGRKPPAKPKREPHRRLKADVTKPPVTKPPVTKPPVTKPPVTKPQGGRPAKSGTPMTAAERKAASRAKGEGKPS